MMFLYLLLNNGLYKTLIDIRMYTKGTKQLIKRLAKFRFKVKG